MNNVHISEQHPYSILRYFKDLTPGIPFQEKHRRAWKVFITYHMLPVLLLSSEAGEIQSFKNLFVFSVCEDLSWEEIFQLHSS